MTTREHIAKAEGILVRCEPDTPSEGIALAIGHALLGWVKHDTGHGYDTEGSA